ncbi:hypothetical protein GCM10028820_01840 [Tessaracoccus terricola]
MGALLVDDAAAAKRVLAARRSTPPVGRWEFPGGKVEPGEGAREALVREIAEELLVDVVVHGRLDPPAGGRWPINDALELELWWCTTDGEPVPHDSHDALGWLTAQELDDVDWLQSDLAAVPVVAARLRG